jgi:uncharacterized protein
MKLVLCLLTASCCFAQEAYVFGFLRAHPERRDIPQEEAQTIQKAHLAHLDKMATDGVLVGAGPLVDSPDIRGLLIFKGITLDKARELASQDPAVINKRLRVETFNWISQPGIGDVLRARMQQKPMPEFKMIRHGFVAYRTLPGAPEKIETPEQKALLKAHMDWVRKNETSFAAFGPFEPSKDFFGVGIFHSPDLKLVKKALEDEPFTKAGWVKPEVYQWFVAEGVMPKPPASVP